MDGELAWTHDLPTAAATDGEVAASENVILSWAGDHAFRRNGEASYFVVDHGGSRVCEWSTDPAQGVMLEAAPAWGPDTFVQLEQVISDDGPPPYRLVRLRVADKQTQG